MIINLKGQSWSKNLVHFLYSGHALFYEFNKWANNCLKICWMLAAPCRHMPTLPWNEAYPIMSSENYKTPRRPHLAWFCPSPQQIYIYIHTYNIVFYMCISYHIYISYIYIYLWVARIQLKVICPTQTSMRRLISKLPYLTITHLCWKMHKLLNQVYPNISPSPSKTSAGFVGEWLIT